MGLVYADVELTSSVDLENARSYVVGEEEVKRL